MSDRLRHCRGIVAVILLVIWAAGCASINSYQELQQPLNAPLQADLNGQVFKVSRKSDLPNAFGKADAFGGKIDRGFIELRYLGLAPDGRVRLRITDIDTASTETTMSRYGVGQARVTSTTTTTSYGSWTTATGVYIPPASGRTDILPPNTLEFFYDQDAGPLSIAGVQVMFLTAGEVSVTYRLLKVGR